MDKFQVKSEAFIAWLSSCNVSVNPKISLADLRNQHAGRGVVALENIDEDEILFRVPRTAVLTASNSDLYTQLPELPDELDPWTSLILAMVYEYLKGSNSTWKPYFDILPESFDTPMFWTPDELAELQGSSLVHKIGKAKADETFKTHIIPLIRSRQDVFLATGTEISDEGLLALAHRMGSTIMAYAFDIEKVDEEKELDEEGYASEEDDEALPKGMVPLADMLNADADRNNGRLYYEQTALVMKAILPIQAGQEVYNDYGPLPQSDLLRRYGYTTSNYAQHDVVELSHDFLIGSLKKNIHLSEIDFKTRLDYLEEEGVTDTGYDISRQVPEEPIQESFSPDLLTIVSTLLLPEAEFQRLQNKAKLPKIGPMPASVANLIIKAVQDRALQYSTTPDDDNQILTSLTEQQSSSGLSSHQRRLLMAVQVRLGEKHVLTEAEQALRRLESIAQESDYTTKRKAIGESGSPSKRFRES